MPSVTWRGVESAFLHVCAHTRMCVSACVPKCVPVPRPRAGGSKALAALHPSAWVRMSDFWIPTRNEQDQEATREPLTAQHLAWNGQGLGARGWPRA